MPVKIVRSESRVEKVKTELVVSTIETNRDRVRTTNNMLITLSGILIPACLAFLLFFIEKGFSNVAVFTLLAIAVLLFLFSSSLSIVSSLLRNKYSILDEVQFIENLLSLYDAELRIANFAFILMLIGMLSMIAGILVFATMHWRW